MSFMKNSMTEDAVNLSKKALPSDDRRTILPYQAIRLSKSGIVFILRLKK